MDNFEKRHCRLCLGIIRDELFKEIKDVTKFILNVLLLKLNLDNTSKYIMCNICSRMVMEAFRFKSMCVNTNNTIVLYVEEETGRPIDLKQVYVKETEKNHIVPTLRDYQVCRFCMRLVKDKFIQAHEMAVDMIKMYIPEINLIVVEDPVICKQCFDSFVSHSNFIKNCLEVNKKIKSFCGTAVVDDSVIMASVDSCIKTEEVDIKSENEQEEDWFETDSAMVRSVYEGISNKISYSEIEAQDKDEKSGDDGRPAESSQCSIKVDNTKYSLPERASTPSYFQISNNNVSNVHECDACDYKSEHKGNFERHLLSQKDISETKVFECDTCGYKTKHNSYLKRHQLIHKDISETEVFQCYTCDYRSKRKNDLGKHQLTHKNISEAEAFQCDTCGYKTKFSGNLKIHLLRHKDFSKTEIFECDICDYKTKYKGNLTKHHLSHKDISESKVFQCDACDYKTKYKTHLKGHQLRHKNISETETFRCDTCDFKTKYKTSLEQHRQLHKGICKAKLFACDTCDHKTKQKGNLKQHQLMHKDISETKVFACDSCDYKSKRKSNLKTHQVMHRDISEKRVFACDACDYKVKRKRDLKRHLLKHHLF